jgi:hypothetical protein
MVQHLDFLSPNGFESSVQLATLGSVSKNVPPIYYQKVLYEADRLTFVQCPERFVVGLTDQNVWVDCSIARRALF